MNSNKLKINEMSTIDYEVEIDLDDIISEYSDSYLVLEVEERGYTVIEPDKSGNRGSDPQNLLEELCKQFDLPRAATTKQQLLTHINSLL